MNSKQMTPGRIAEIRARDAARTPGKWKWWTSCSFRRLSARGDGDVAYGCIQASDGHPDIQIREPDMAFIEESTADIPDLLADNDRLRQALRDVLTVCRDRQAFVTQGPRAFARAEQIAKEALG